MQKCMSILSRRFIDAVTDAEYFVQTKKTSQYSQTTNDIELSSLSFLVVLK